MCQLDRVGRTKRKRCSRDETKEQVFSAVRFPSTIRDPSTKHVARQVGIAVSTYLINILKELEAENRIDMTMSLNSRGFIKYHWHVGRQKMKQEILPF